jgi:predicted AlkP superfamily pyrophosphatase or phosphodiesterase
MDYDMRNLAPTVSALLGVRPPGGAEVGPVCEIVSHLLTTQRLAMVVIDAFGVATWENARGFCPTINALGANHCMAIRSVLPAITPVNFATMVTGASPQSHTIRARTEELKLETLFHILRSEGRLTAAVGRALSTVGILLARFPDLRGVAESNEDKEVLELGLAILRERQPDYLLLQFLAVDATGHKHGPFSPDSVQAVAQTDALLRILARQLADQHYCLLLLADHGQHTASPDERRPGHLGAHSGGVTEDVQVPLVWASSQELEGIARAW